MGDRALEDGNTNVRFPPHGDSRDVNESFKILKKLIHIKGVSRPELIHDVHPRNILP